MSANLHDLIRHVPADRAFLLSENNRLSYGELAEKISAFKNAYPQLINTRCAVASHSRFLLAVFLPCLDSMTTSLFLQPSGLGEKELNEFYRSAGIEWLVKIETEQVQLERINAEPTSCSQNSKWLIATSGTTGTPKLLGYELHSLIATCQKDVSKGEQYRWGLSYDLNRFAGLQVYFQAISSGSSIVISEDGDSLADSVDLFYRNSVNVLSATPSYWRKILMLPNSGKLNLLRITLGGEIAEQSILDALKAKFNNSAITHIYASTEIGVGFAVKDGLAGFPISFMSSSEQPNIKIFDDKLYIKSERGASELLSGNLQSIEGFVDTGDRVKIVGERVFFEGRESGAINVGGSKVMPEEVESVLNSHADVVSSRVFGKKSSVLGMLVAAEVQLIPSLDDVDDKKIKTELVNFCRKKLSDFKVPALIKTVSNIEMNHSGKVVRNK